MNRGVHMRAVMLQHPKTSREVPVLFHCGIHLRFKPALVPRPRYQLVIDRVTEVQHPRLPAGNAGEQTVASWFLRKKRHRKEHHKCDDSNDETPRPPGDTHLSPSQILLLSICHPEGIRRGSPKDLNVSIN